MTEVIRKTKPSVCCIATGIILIFFFLVFIIALILPLAVYKPKKPLVCIQSATVQGNTSLPTDAWSRFRPPRDVQLNFTLDLQILVENRNSLSFKHEIGKTLVVYREMQIGEVDLPSGTLPAKGSSILACRLTLQIDKFVADVSGLWRDIIIRRKIGVSTKIKIAGEVKFLGIFNKYLVAIWDCKFDITFEYPPMSFHETAEPRDYPTLSSIKMQNQECVMSTKL